MSLHASCEHIQQTHTYLDQILVSMFIAGQGSFTDQLSVKQFCDQHIGLHLHIPLCSESHGSSTQAYQLQISCVSLQTAYRTKIPVNPIFFFNFTQIVQLCCAVCATLSLTWPHGDIGGVFVNNLDLFREAILPHNALCCLSHGLKNLQTQQRQRQLFKVLIKRMWLSNTCNTEI